MARFSIGTAINDAFRLVGRRPLSVFIWGLLIIAPSAASVGLLLPMMGQVFGEMAIEAGGHSGPTDAGFADMMQFQALSGLLNIVQLLLMVVVYAAIMRAVIRPRETSFFSLRLGMDELRVAVVALALIVGVYAVMGVLALIGVAIGFAVWGAGSPTNWLVIIGLVVTAIVAICLGAVRVSMMLPATVLYRTFGFAEGWRLGRGQTGPLFGMALLLILMVIVIETVVFGIGLAIAMAAGMTGGLDWSALHSHNMDVNPFEGLEAALAANWPWFAAGAVFLAMVYGVLLTLHIAPYASACRQLVESGTPSAPDEHSSVA